MKDLLIPDHLELDTILEQLFSALENGTAEEVYQKLDYFWARLAMHIRAEHLHLFPAILKAARNAEQTGANAAVPASEIVESSIGNLQNDHNFFMRELGAAVKQMSGTRKDKRPDEAGKLTALRDKLSAVRRRLEAHNELEESVVYRWAEMLSSAELTVLESKIQKELENLPPRFRKN